MREIKFRAWDKQLKEMASVICLNIGEWSEDHILKSKSHPYTYNQVFENIELMQFTGLLDKNGNEIYEGDILLVPEFYETPEMANTDYIQWVVVFKFGMFTLENKENTAESDSASLHSDLEAYDGDFEVIGNVYEHPELVKP